MRFSIKECFNQAAVSYDAFCMVQENVACELINQLSLIQVCPRKIIDLGCGTGMVTSQLAHNYNNYQKFYAIDIAEQMLIQAASKLKHLNIKVYEADFDKFPYIGVPFDLIFSNMALQWSTNLTKTLAGLYNSLAKGGLLAFSIPATGTFNELPPSSVMTFYQFHNVHNMLLQCGFKVLNASIYQEQSEFNSIFTALQSIKKTGANYISKTHCSHAPNSSLFSSLLKQRRQERSASFSLTYRIATFIAVKHDT